MTIIRLPGTQHREQDFSLSPEVVGRLWEMEQRHFWHRARNAWILDALRAGGVLPPARILDVGCGSGAVARALAASGYTVTGVDTAEHLVLKAHERCPNCLFVVGDVGGLPEGFRGPFDAVGFFDVLEHLEAPSDLLKAALQWAVPGALCIATVPALRSLHSLVDDLSGHKLRYERGEMASLFQAAGVENTVEYGIFASTLRLQRWERRTSETTATVSPSRRERVMKRALRVPPFPVNTLLSWLVGAERRRGLEAARNRVGATILAVGRLGNVQS